MDKVVVTFLLVVLCCFLWACDSNDNSFDEVVKVSIVLYSNLGEYQADNADSHAVEIHDKDRLAEIISLYTSMEYTGTSRPMDFPRYLVQFYNEEGIIAHLYMSNSPVSDNLTIISGSKPIRGNNILSNERILEVIEDLYQNP